MKYELKLFLLLSTLIALPCIILSLFALQSLEWQEIVIEKKIKEGYTALAFTAKKHLMERIHKKIDIIKKNLDETEFKNDFIPVTDLSIPLNDPFFFDFYLIDSKYRIIYPKKRPQNKQIDSKNSLLMPIDNYHLFEVAYYYEFQKKDYIKAINKYQKIVSELKEENQETLGNTLIAIARCYLKANELSKALETYKNLTKIYDNQENSKNLRFIIDAKGQIANIYQKQNKIVRYYETLLDLFELIIFNKFLLGNEEYEYLYERTKKQLSQLKNEPPKENFNQKFLLKKYNSILKQQEETLKQEKKLKTLDQYVILKLKKRNNKGNNYISYQINNKNFLVYCVKLSKKNFNGYAIYSIDVDYALRKIVIPVIYRQDVSKNVRLSIIDADSKIIIKGTNYNYSYIVSKTLSPAFPFWGVAVYLKNVQSLQELSRFRSELYLLGLVSIILILLVGVCIIIRTFIREVKRARLKSDFVSNVTHELKTPLTAIKMFVETLLMGRASTQEEQKECLQIISAETGRLGSLIDRILHFAKMEQKKKAFHFSYFPLNDLIKETVQEFQNKILEEENCNIQANIEADLPKICMDKEAIRESLTNLLSNSYKYNDKKIKNIRVHVYRKNEDYVAISIKDNGIGIPRQEARKIFKKFYRVMNEKTQTIEGTGLGLALLKSIIKAHRGTVKVQSKINIGSEFIMNLPVNRE